MNISKLLKEPLLHFIAVGAALFFIYYATAYRPDINKSGDIIVISSSDIERLAYLFEKTWQRPPNNKELKGLVDDYLEEEVLYREAMKLGLDMDDTVVRRRMRQKMEFFVNDLTQQTAPTEKQLKEFLQKNKDKYRTESRLSFKQIFFKPDKESENRSNRIINLREKLNKKQNSIQNTTDLGDATILPVNLEMVTVSEVDNQFGKGFGYKLYELAPNRWEGPVESVYGYHLIFIEEKTEGEDPKLSEIRSEVERDWKYSLQKEIEQEYLKKKLDEYNVQIQWPEINVSIKDIKD